MNKLETSISPVLSLLINTGNIFKLLPNTADQNKLTSEQKKCHN